MSTTIKLPPLKREREDEPPDADNKKKAALYKVDRVLGSGAFATVKLCHRGDLKLAMKVVDKGRTPAVSARLELKVLGALGLHENIIGLVDTFEQPAAWVFVLELAAGGEVFDRICERGPYSEADAADVARQVGRALLHMHKKGVCHRDLKPENLLLCSQHSNRVKVADFGLAAFCGGAHPPMVEMVGTVAYAAPEVLTAGEKNAYSWEVDMWSLGAIVFTLLGAYSPFDPWGNASEAVLRKRVIAVEWGFDHFPEQWRTVSEEARATLRRMLEPDPARRMTAEELLACSWLQHGVASAEPLPNSESRLQQFNKARRIWREAADAAALAVRTPNLVLQFHQLPEDANEKHKQLSPAALFELRAAFERYDRDGSGAIDLDELSHVMRLLGARPGECEKTFRLLDADGNGSIDFDEFCAAVGPLYDASVNSLRKAFALFDADASGFIDRAELKAVLYKLGFLHGTTDESEQCLTGMFAAADTDGDGKVSFDEFVQLFAKHGSSLAAQPQQDDAAAAAFTSSAAAGSRAPN